MLPLVPHPVIHRKNSPFCSSCVIFMSFSRIYRIGEVFSFFAANKYPVPIDAQHQKNVAQGYSPRPQNIKTKFPVHKAVEVQGKYTCAFFVLATDDAKKCTAITAHVHWKCAVISVYFFASGKARLPKTHPLRVACPLPMPFRHTRAFW